MSESADEGGLRRTIFKKHFFLKIKVFQLIENTSPAELEGKKKTRNQT